MGHTKFDFSLHAGRKQNLGGSFPPSPANACRGGEPSFDCCVRTGIKKKDASQRDSIAGGSLSFFFRRAPERERERERWRKKGEDGRGGEVPFARAIDTAYSFYQNSTKRIFVSFRKQFFNFLTNYFMLSPFHKHWNSFLWYLQLKGGRRRFSRSLRVLVCVCVCVLWGGGRKGPPELDGERV